MQEANKRKETNRGNIKSTANVQKNKSDQDSESVGNQKLNKLKKIQFKRQKKERIKQGNYFGCCGNVTYALIFY